MIGWSIFVVLVLIIFATRPKQKPGVKGAMRSTVKGSAGQTGKNMVNSATGGPPKFKDNSSVPKANTAPARTYNAVVTITRDVQTPVSPPSAAISQLADKPIQRKAVNDLMGSLTNIVSSPLQPNDKPRTVVTGFMKPTVEVVAPIPGQKKIADHELVVIKPLTGIPAWAPTYIYSRDELRSAKPEQKKFYEYYRKCFDAGEIIEVGEQTNYGFILYFDLIHEYRTHLDLDLLEHQFGRLEKSCPKTQSYAHSFLVAKMREFGDEVGLARIGYVEHWRTRYEKLLKLSANEQKYYDAIYLSSNSFINIDQCGLETLRLYIRSINLLPAQYQLAGTTMGDSFHLILDLIARKENRYHLNSPNYKYTVEQSNQVYSIILRYCENQLREIYGHKRKINLVNEYRHKEVIDAINLHLISHLDSVQPELIQNVPAPAEATVIALNTVNITRWKNYIELTEKYFNEIGKAAFLEQLDQLVNENRMNPSQETIFFELCRFLSPLDKLAALQYYLGYIKQNAVAQKLALKPMPKPVKAIFDNEKQYLLFEDIALELKRTQDLDTALTGIQAIFNPPRKKISLDSETIQQVVADHSETVAVLNEYLRDDEEDIANVPISEPMVPPVINDADVSLYNPAVIAGLNHNARQLLDLFKSCNLEINKADIDSYCRDKGLMKRALIDGINEHFYELFDDILIEEQFEGKYAVSPEYFSLILNSHK